MCHGGAAIQSVLRLKLFHPPSSVAVPRSVGPGEEKLRRSFWYGESAAVQMNHIESFQVTPPVPMWCQSGTDVVPGGRGHWFLHAVMASRRSAAVIGDESDTVLWDSR